MKVPGSAQDPLWYKDGIIYEAHVRAFFDSNNDGIGDFQGLTQKLDYLSDLGITAIWLLPFYPSPLRDDGYDIARYEGIHPAYGTLRDFRYFMREAHQRNIQVITELVVNHTSDQHPWFQAARKAPARSAKRDFYVWSETDTKYAGVRIIFTDSEKSNWMWDPVAKGYYWHRFFYHQPELNYDNPHVRRAIMKVMRFWFDIGVDGMRLDAVPYLIEREGTNCENLPETHEVLKQFRRELDEHYENRMFLAEANQWPADVRPYFGDGDECHMGFHFPLMPRIFMALRQEDRHPITDILRQTPDIPDNCQWALFLRNHDELTLEMVTDEERDYMYQAYAADPQMRLNMGIRRRLAPLVENSRRRIELLVGLLFSFPGAPVIYYGDEIGMGDNIYLGDRNGVRTPMQWTSDRNAGFSRADPARLYAPVIMDPLYGYQAINVEAQERSPFSLLNWMKRLIALRKQHRTFSRGTIEFLQPQNRKVLAYFRRYENETILAVANLSRTVQPVELNLSAQSGLTPIEMLGRTEFPRIGQLPYFLTLGPYSFYWFTLERTPSSITARVPPQAAEPVEEAPVLLAGVAWETLLDGNVRTLIERDALVPFLKRQRWFGGKARAIRSARIADWAALTRGNEPTFLTFVEVLYTDGLKEHYFLPLAARSSSADMVAHSFSTEVLARIGGARKGVICDAGIDDAAGEVVLAAIEAAREVRTRYGTVRAFPTASYRAVRGDGPPGSLKLSRASEEQSNTSLVYGNRMIMKLFRRIEPGPNPDFEICQFLTERAHFPRVPPLAGGMEYHLPGVEPTTLAMLQGLIPNQGNGWDRAIDELGRYFERVSGRTEPPPAFGEDARSRLKLADTPVPPAAAEIIGGFLENAAKLGRRTAELHLALASDSTDPAFRPEAVTPAEFDALAAAMETHAAAVLALLEQSLPNLPAATALKARDVLGGADRLRARLRQVASLENGTVKIRVHGDYHLGQVLWAENDFVIIDFEGEPARTLAERRAKQLALKDVTGMLRSYSYAAYAALFAHTVNRPPDFDRLEPWARLWEAWNCAVFLRSYLVAAAAAPFVPTDRGTLDMLLDAFLLDKALYELRYELNSRPGWLDVPLWGILPLVT